MQNNQLDLKEQEQEQVSDPRKAVIADILHLIKETKQAITFSRALEKVCGKNKTIRDYLGNRRLTIEDNKRYRKLREIFLKTVKDRNISIVSLKPLTLCWSEGVRYIHTDICTNTDIVKDTNSKVEVDKEQSKSELSTCPLCLVEIPSKQIKKHIQTHAF